MARLARGVCLSVIVLTYCENSLHEARAFDVEIVAENMLQDKSVYIADVKPIRPRLTSRYWADLAADGGQGGNFRTLEVSWDRRPDIRYYKIVLLWSTDNPKLLSGVAFDYDDKSFVDLQVVDDGKRSVLSLNLKNVAQESIDHIRRIALRYDHSLARSVVDKAVESSRGVGGLWEAERLNIRAWYLSTFPVNAVRDGKQALADAARAVQLCDEPTYRDTLAAAYAEVGDFENALREEQRAIESLDAEQEEAQQMKGRADVDKQQLEATLGANKTLRRGFTNNLALLKSNKTVKDWTYPY